MNTRNDKTTVWRLTPHHTHPNEALQWAKKTGCLAIGWGDIGDIKAQGYTSPQAIAEAVKKHFPDRRNASGYEYSLHDFCYRMRRGDWVIIRFDNRCHVVMEVSGDYEYKLTPEEPPIGNYQHQRRATILSLDPNDLWRKVGGLGQGKGKRNPYPPLVECLNPIDAETKAALTLTVLDSKERETTVFLTASYVSADEVDADGMYQEGAVRQVTVNAYERSPQARRQCIALYGLQCCVCGFHFGKFYGEAGSEYIHVHHLVPV